MPDHQFETFDKAYRFILEDVLDNFEYKSAPRGLPIREILNYQFSVAKPTARTPTTADEHRNRVMAAYFGKESHLYGQMTNRVEDFGRAAPFWKTIANPDGTVSSAYGYLLWKHRSASHPVFAEGAKMTQWEWVIHSLTHDQDTRQAFFHIALPEHQWIGNRDQVCTMHGQFFIREGKLFLTVVMRASDVVLGLPYDVPWFMSLMDRMLVELSSFYPNLTKGSYTHIAHSIHMYERDYERVLKMLGR